MFYRVSNGGSSSNTVQLVTLSSWSASAYSGTATQNYCAIIPMTTRNTSVYVNSTQIGASLTWSTSDGNYGGGLHLVDCQQGSSIYVVSDNAHGFIVYALTIVE